MKRPCSLFPVNGIRQRMIRACPSARVMPDTDALKLVLFAAVEPSCQVVLLVIAASVQLVEMIMEKFFPVAQSQFGIFLPLITVNCTVLAVSLFMVLRKYTYLKSLVFAFGSALGWMLAIIMVAAINERLKLVGDIPEGLRGPGLIMVIAGIISLAFLGFGGMVNV